MTDVPKDLAPAGITQDEWDDYAKGVSDSDELMAEAQLKRAVTHPNGTPLEYQFENDGWIYATHSEDEFCGEVAVLSKLSHYAIRGNEAVYIEWTPYHTMETEEFALWLRLGQPGRQGPQPLNARNLMHLAERRIARTA